MYQVAELAYSKPAMTFTELSIRFEPRDGDAYPVRARTDGGRARGRFRLPESARELAVASRAPASPRDIETHHNQGAAITDSDRRAAGGALFQSLFSDDVAALYYQHLGALRFAGSTGLRICLVFDPELPTLYELTELPWELLYDAGERHFLALHRQTTVVRRLELRRVMAPANRPGPLRILVAAANPPGSEPLALDRELARIRQALDRVPNVKVSCLRSATASALRDALLREKASILHFMGHGRADRSSGAFGLALEPAANTDGVLSGDGLTALFAGVGLKVAVLNACHTAAVPASPGHDPFSGATTALAAAGLPAVVGMTRAVADRAAIAFAQTLYRHVALGASFEVAVNEARLALKVGSYSDWGAPALYLSTTGQVAPDRPVATPGQATAAPAPARSPGVQPLARLPARFGILAVLAVLLYATYSGL